MSKKAFINHNQLLTFFLIAILSLGFAGCRTFSTNPEISTNQPQEPAAPQAPVVVDGKLVSYADVVERTSPAVVEISAERVSKNPQQFPFGNDMFRDFFREMPEMPQDQRPRVERGLGSGVIVSADGTILTNHHVVDGAEKINVQTSDDRVFEAKIIGSDPPSDLAVLKIEGENFPFLNLGNSDNVRIGDIVLAIGNPLGIGQTVTQGIISANGRRTGLSDGSFEDFLQTDAAINRGNSGGALVNLTGELIGVNSQILSPSGVNIGIGFAIPSNMAKSVMDQLLKEGKVKRGQLGVIIQNVTPEMARSLDLTEAHGVIVSDVRKGSAAEKAGVRRGDIITAINGEKIEDSNVLRNKVAGTLPGSEITLSVLRDGNQQQLKAVLDEFNVEGVKPANPQDENNREKPSEEGKLGLTLEPLTPQMAQRLQVPADTTGLVVTEVDPNGVAATEGVARGDVIIEINRQPVQTVEEAKSILDRAGDRPVLLLISRRGQTSFVPIKPR